MSDGKRRKVNEPDYNPKLSEIIDDPEDYVCRFNQPPPGQKAEWREIDEDVEAVMDESSSEEENDSKHEEHLFNVALGQYNDMIAKDPTNSTLIARRDALVKNRQQEIDSRNNAES